MSRKFFPGCKVKARYPEASEWLAEQVIGRGYADEIVGCCRTDHQSLTADDTAVCICNNCMAMIDEDAENGDLENIWVLVDNDPGFPLPSYEGKTMGVQDCGRAYDRIEVQDAVRSLMRKMGIEVVELPDSREESRFCGQSFLRAAPEQDASFAPKRYVEDAAERGIFTPLDPDAMQARLDKHAAAIPTDEVCCYCFACDMGLEAGGKDAINMIELVSGKFRKE
ncbi:hypothetical protein [Adlercreutzia sp. ZJ473]|uniref:hypothetical protein n=1 Tax=Adlercreutzia sp. ZJ473 TaxID=2722822 RepID=UPI001557D8FA|nr:hypothetical protein [Adlercreutzia sp. ZJ473]